MKNRRNIIGSPAGQAFKNWHKTLGDDLYASDVDLALVQNGDIIAFIDFKANETDRATARGKSLTYGQLVLYNCLAVLAYKVFIVKADWSGSRCGNCGNGVKSVGGFSNFTIEQFEFSDKIPYNRKIVLENGTAEQYLLWERNLRGI